MVEKRKSKRLDLKAVNVRGKLYNVINFKVRDISLGGIKLLSNFHTEISTRYTIILFNDGEQQDFEIEILRVEVDSFSTQESSVFSPGIVYAISGQFIRLDEIQKKFLLEFMKKSGGDQEMGVFPDMNSAPKK